MDWNLKAPSWEFTDLEEESSRIGVYKTEGEFSVDLKLGRHHHVGNNSVTQISSSNLKDVVATSSIGVSKIASSSTSSGTSSKRARGINNGNLNVTCVVDGCNSDLSNCRDYHRRHKVCELHSKTPEVTIAGQKQRFCQQCSRFHALDQFDDRKRSCRKRLDGHNRRRRKSQADPVTRPGNFLSNYQGTQLLPFSTPHAYPSTAMANNLTWSSGGINITSNNSDSTSRLQNQQLHLVDHNKQHLFLETSPTNNSYREEGNNTNNNKQLPFLHTTDDDNIVNLSKNSPFPALSSSSVCESLLRTNSLPVIQDSSSSTCALSLLSSSSSSSQKHTTHHPHDQQMVHHHQTHSMPIMENLGLSLHENNNNNLDYCSSVYNMGGSDNGAHGSHGNHDGSQLLFPFQWE